MSIKNKKAMEGGIWWIIIGAVIALAVGIVVLYIITGGLSAERENISILSSCETQGGTCKCDSSDPTCTSGCGPDDRKLRKFGGCPPESDSSKIYCCIPK